MTDINKLEHYLTRLRWMMQDIQYYGRRDRYNSALMTHQHSRLKRIWNRVLQEAMIK